MKFRVSLPLIVLICLVHAADAQSYLVLRKKGSTRKYQYFRGNEFVYRMKGIDQFFKDRITDFADSTLILENNILLIDQIAEVDVRNANSNRPGILRSAESVLPGIGIGLMALDIFNHTVVDGRDFSLDRRTTITSAALVGSGYALRFMRRKKINLEKPRFEAYIVGL